MVSPLIMSRTFDRISPIMYHGTNSSNCDSLLNGINTLQSKRRTDFGNGFYLTSDFIQASEQATNKSKPMGDQPIVFMYKLDVVTLRDNFTKMIFHKMDEVWAQFIYDNRSKIFQKKHTYDYVFGGVADGTLLFPLIDEMDNAKMETGEINIVLFLESIAYYTYDQLSLHNQSIISSDIIKLIKVVNAYDSKTDFVTVKAI